MSTFGRWCPAWAALAVGLVLLAGCASKEVVLEEPQVARAVRAPEQPGERGPAPPPGEALRPQPPGREDAERADRERRLREFQREREAFDQELIHFDFDRSEIRPDAQETLKRKAQFLLKYTDVRIQIEGHCDERGTNQYNLALGMRRATSAKNFLVSLGVKAERIDTISYGEERPLDPGKTEEAWAKNRRAKFNVISVPAGLAS